MKHDGKYYSLRNSSGIVCLHNLEFKQTSIEVGWLHGNEPM